MTSTLRQEFNFSNHTAMETDDATIRSAFVIYINLFLYIFALIGNGILIFAFFKDVQMQTTTNMLVVSHLLAELAVSCAGIATKLFSLVVDDKPLETSARCIAGAFVVKMCLGSGFLSLVGISVDRYLAVVKKVHHKVTKKRVLVFLSVIWILSIAFGIPWSIVFRGSIDWNFIAVLIVNCQVNGFTKQSTTADKFFMYLIFIIGVVLPVCLIAFTSHGILVTALKTRRRVGIIGTNVNHIAAAYNKSAFTTILITSVYFLCLVPALVLSVMCRNRSSNCEFEYQLFFYFARVILCFRSACFPVIFAVRGRNFSRYIREFLNKKIEVYGRYLIIARRSSNIENVYNCSSTQTDIGRSHACLTPDPRNLDKSSFNIPRKLAFVDLEKHSF